MLYRLWEIIAERRRWREATHSLRKPDNIKEEEEDSSKRPPFVYYGPLGRESDGSTQLNQTEVADIYFVFLNLLHKLEDRFYSEADGSGDVLPPEFMKLKHICKELAHAEIVKLALWVEWERRVFPPHRHWSNR